MTGAGDDGDRPLPPLPRTYERVLAICAHPDDAEFMFGGTVARLIESGSDVAYLVCTDGMLGGEDPEVDAAELGARRRAEQRAAADRLGVGVITFLGLADGTLVAGPRLRKLLSRVIRTARPDLLLTHQPVRSLVFPIGASHPDHLAVGEAALCAAFPDAGNPRAFPELLAEGLAPHAVAEVWVPGFEHTSFHVALDRRHVTAKQEAILRHASQFERSPSPEDAISWVGERMAGYGPAAGSDWGEGFVRVVCGTSAGPAVPAGGPTDVPPRGG